MPRTLILHIGLSKTGSSSIQRTLAGQRTALQALGAYYPVSPGAVNHGLLAAAVVKDKRQLWAVHPAVWEGVPMELRLARVVREWQAEMAALPDWVERCVISAEMIGGLLRDAEELAALAALLRPYFDPIRVVVYLRRQDQHSASAYSQWLRNGMAIEPGLPGADSPDSGQLDYDALLCRFAGAFGEAAMCPRIFERGRMVNGDVLDDFLQVAGIALDVPAESPDRRSNPSLKAEGQELLLLLIRKMACDAPARSLRGSAQWIRLAQSLSESLPGRGWRPSRGEARAYMEHFAASNERVRQRYFPEQATLFAEDYEMLPASSERPQAADIAAAAVDALLYEIGADNDADTKAAMNQYRLARQLDDGALMRSALEQALRWSPDMVQARLRLAELLHGRGEFLPALQHAVAAASLDPGSLPAQRLVRRCQRAVRGNRARAAG